MKVDDEKLIEQLCSDTWEVIYRFVYYKVQNREEAEDITQETYSKAISYVQKNNVKIDNLINFLKTVSMNVLRDKWRKGKRQGTSINLDDINVEDQAIQDPTETMAKRELILNALELLNGEQREVINLRILKGYSVSDTAKKMGKTENNIRVLQYRALQKLTKILKNNY